MASIDQISIAGFSDPTTVAELRRTRCANVPSHTGIYLIERDAEGAPKFRILSTGDWFNGLDPDYPLDIIQAIGLSARTSSMSARLQASWGSEDGCVN